MCVLSIALNFTVTFQDIYHHHIFSGHTSIWDQKQLMLVTHLTLRKILRLAKNKNPAMSKKLNRNNRREIERPEISLGI
jgi:hypothetical protein